ncbi:MAG: helix-turn-helix transcriptional regulator [Candidatus Heimdallarchaeota archaeon]|nr:MAG: helix-turn-helix transcriptional regulator [Candidatus Heimdallarchaeota archaeon]
MSDKEVNEEEILKSAERITELLKALTHPNRLKILALLSEESKDFSTLLTKTGLRKTALSNHLTQLLSVKIIIRVERGKYEITKDGQNLLLAAMNVYKESELRRDVERKLLKKRYSKGFGMKKMDKKIISEDEKVSYQPCWISYLGAVSGVLKYLGKDHDICNVGGYSGYVFALPNVSKGTTCPSGPTALAVWEEIIKATDTLGFKVQSYDENQSFPSQNGDLTPEDLERAQNLFKQVKNVIDNEDRPVVLWGLQIPEYGIVKGYTDDSYIVSTYRSLMDQPDTPLRFDSLQAPGCLHAIYFKENSPPISEEEDRKAIQRAIAFTQGTKVQDGYVAGSAAYEEWANVLDKGRSQDLLYHGNAYVAACTLEAKELSLAFLRRLADKYKGKKQAEILLQVSQEYEKVVTVLKELQQLFPFAMEGEMPEEKRMKGTQLLRSVIPYESHILSLLQQCYEVWE